MGFVCYEVTVRIGEGADVFEVELETCTASGEGIRYALDVALEAEGVGGCVVYCSGERS